MTKSVIRLPDFIFESTATPIKLFSINSQMAFSRRQQRIRPKICPNRADFTLNQASIPWQTMSFRV